MREKESFSEEGREKADPGITVTGAGSSLKVDETRREFLVKAGLIIGSLAGGLVLSAYCSRSDKDKPKPGRAKNNLEIMFDAEPVIETAQVRETYDKGFSLVFEKLDHSLDPSRMLLQRLKEFKDQRVKWVDFEDFAGNKLKAGGGHIAVIPPGNPRLKSQYFIAGMESEPQPTVLIRPHKVSAEFAGLNGIHETSHLYDFVTGVEPEDPTDEQYFMGEVRAWEAQIAAADLLTDGRFSKGIGVMYSKYGDELIDHVFGGDGDPVLQSVREYFDNLITKDKPGKIERTLRDAMYAMGICFYPINRGAADVTERNSRKMEVYKLFHNTYAKGLER